MSSKFETIWQCTWPAFLGGVAVSNYVDDDRYLQLPIYGVAIGLTIACCKLLGSGATGAPPVLPRDETHHPQPGRKRYASLVLPFLGIFSKRWTNANGVTPQSPGSRYPAHPGIASAQSNSNPNGVAHDAATTFHLQHPSAASGATPLGLARLWASFPRVRGVPRPWAMELNAFGVGVLLFLLSLPPALRADDLSPESCAAALQKSTLTVRIRLHPEVSKEPATEDDSLEKSTAQVTVCSGVAVGENLVVTAAFAAADSQIRLTLPGGEQTEARLRVLDEFSGLALLEASDAMLHPLAISKAAEKPAVGSWIMSAAGWGADAPLVSVGIVGGVDRAIKGYVYPPLLQCDIRPAETSSGAPLVDRRGELLGVIVGGDRPESQRGWLYAVPVSHVQRLLRARSERTKEDSVVVLKRKRPTCGVDLVPGDTGILVSKVEAGGPAERAGMKIGDRILTADGQNVRYLYEAKRSTLYKQPGDTITFVVQRGEEQKKFELVLGGGVELPSASLDKLGELVAPKIDMNLAPTPRGSKSPPSVTIKEPYGADPPSQREALTAEKMRILEKLNAEYKAKIEQQQQELARSAEERKAQAEAIEAIRAELEAVKKGSK